MSGCRMGWGCSFKETEGQNALNSFNARDFIFGISSSFSSGGPPKCFRIHLNLFLQDRLWVLLDFPTRLLVSWLRPPPWGTGDSQKEEPRGCRLPEAWWPWSGEDAPQTPALGPRAGTSPLTLHCCASHTFVRTPWGPCYYKMQGLDFPHGAVIGIHRLKPGTLVRPLVWDDPNYVHAPQLQSLSPRGHALQREKPVQWEAHHN